MAINEVFVDPAIAADSGAGTVGDPFGDLEFALEQTTPATDGDRFNIKAGTAELLEFQLDILTDYGTPTESAPLVFQGYTAAQGDGGIGEVNNAAANRSVINAITVDFTSLIDLKLGNTGTALIIHLDFGTTLLRCEFHTSSHTTPVDVGPESNIIDCYFHTFTTATANSHMALASQAGTFVYRNFFDGGTADWDGAVAAASGSTVIEGNVVHVNNVNAIGIKAEGRSTRVLNNSVFNEAAGTESGINYFANSNHTGVVLNNILEGWSGAGGAAIDISSTASDAMPVIAGNLYFNNATNGVVYGNDPAFLEVPPSGGTVAAASPFTAPASDDFTVTTEAKELAFVQVFRGASSSTNKEDAGACQRVEGTGGALPRARCGVGI